MNVEEALEIAQNSLDQGSFSKVQEIVFRQAWEGRSYQEIAKTSDYELGYIRDVGCKLWQSLSKAIGKRVSKNNFQGVLKRQQMHVDCACRTCGSDSTLPEQLQPSPVVVPQVSTSDLISSEVTTNRYQDWGEAIDVSKFYGRTAELATLNHWIERDRCRLVTLSGMGGIGKTAIAAKLTQQVQPEYQYTIWRSLRNAPAVKELLVDIIRFLSRQEVSLLNTEEGLLSLLMGYLRRYRCLLVLDNAESVIQQGERSGRYRLGYQAYGQLLRRIADEPHQSCLLLTSREKPIGIAAKEGQSLPVRSLQLTGLMWTEAEEILQAKGLAPTEIETRKLVEYYAGNPLALKIATTTIQSLFNGDISFFLAQGTIVFGEIWELLDQQFNRLSDTEKQVMYWLATNSDYFTLAELLEDFDPTPSQRQVIEALESLQQRSLLQKDRFRFSQQPLFREYMSEQLNTYDKLSRIALSK